MHERSSIDGERVSCKLEGLSARADVTHKFGGNKLVLSGAFQDQYQCERKKIRLPGILSAELSSDTSDGFFHYKVGLHEVG